MEEKLREDNDISETLERLKKIKIDISIPPNASSSDKGLYNLLIEGTKDNNIKELYSFVQSVEMGCGFYSSETVKVKRLYDKAIEANQHQVVEILNDKNELIDIVWNCYCIENQLKIKLLQSLDLTNEFVIFELIRQLLEDIHLEELKDNSFRYKEVLGEAIIKLSTVSSSLFQYLIERFEHKEQFYHVMGVALGNMTTIAREVYVNSISLTKQDKSYYSYVRILLQTMEEPQFHSFINDIKEVVYNRWIDYLATLLLNREFVSDVIINSYGDLILNCLCQRYEDTELFFKDYDAAITEFNEHIYRWYEKSTEYSSMYYIYATKLFFFKKVQEVNKIPISDRVDIYNKTKVLFDNNFKIHNKNIKVDDITLNFNIKN